MIKINGQKALKELLFVILGLILVLSTRYLAQTSELASFAGNAAVFAFIAGLVGTMAIRYFPQDLITILAWFASLILLGIGLSNQLVDGNWQTRLILAILMAIMIHTDSIEGGYGVKTTPFLASAFVTVIAAIAVCI